jgi:hypothetical protein
MPSRPIVLDGLVADLRRVENWLTASLGVAVDGADNRETPDPFSPPDDLDNLKSAIDRIRPLLWVYLTRQNESRMVQTHRGPGSVRTLMEDALSISDRYVGNND